MQLSPWVGLKSALLSMVELPRQMRASMPKIELLGAATWMWATCPSTTLVRPVAVTVTGMSPGGVSAAEGVSRRGERGRDQRQHDEQPG